jgi:hypothetical protein
VEGLKQIVRQKQVEQKQSRLRRPHNNGRHNHLTDVVAAAVAAAEEIIVAAAVIVVLQVSCGVIDGAKEESVREYGQMR